MPEPGEQQVVSTLVPEGVISGILGASLGFFRLYFLEQFYIYKKLHGGYGEFSSVPSPPQFLLLLIPCFSVIHLLQLMNQYLYIINS